MELRKCCRERCQSRNCTTIFLILTTVIAIIAVHVRVDNAIKLDKKMVEIRRNLSSELQELTEYNEDLVGARDKTKRECASEINKLKENIAQLKLDLADYGAPNVSEKTAAKQRLEEEIKRLRLDVDNIRNGKPV